MQGLAGEISVLVVCRVSLPNMHAEQRTDGLHVGRKLRLVLRLDDISMAIGLGNSGLQAN